MKLLPSIRSLTLIAGLLFLGHFTSAQTFQWVSKASSSLSDNATDVAIDNSGNYYSVGKVAGTINFDSAGFTKSLTSAGQADIYVAKFDCNRNLAWSNRIGGASNDAGALNSIAVDYDNKGNIYVIGSFAGTATFTTKSGSSQVITSSGDYDAFLAKYDTLGVLQWAVKIGSTNIDEGTDLAIDHTGNIVITGYFNGTGIWGATSGPSISVTSGGAGDLFVAKYNTLGQPVWVSKGSSPSQDFINNISVDKQNNIYAAGQFACCSGGTATFGSYSISNTGGWGAFVSKMDSNGVWKWVNGMGSAAQEGVSSCAVDDSGNVFISGSYDGSTSLSSSAPGVAKALTTNGGFDFFIAKYNSSGVLGWAKSVGGTGLETGYDIQVNSRGNIAVAGSFSNTCNFSGISLTSSGGTDMYLAEYSKAGDIIQCIKGGGTGNDLAYRIRDDSKGSIYVAGTYVSIADFGPFSLSGLGSMESFIAKISLDSSAGCDCSITVYDTVTVLVYDSIAIQYDTIQVYDTLWVYHHTYDTTRISVTDTLFIDILTGIAPSGNILNTVKIYPNPAHDVVLIDNGNFTSMSTYSINIINAQGQSVFSNIINQPLFTVSTAKLGGAGTYFIQILDASNHLVESKKLIIR